MTDQEFADLTKLLKQYAEELGHKPEDTKAWYHDTDTGRVYITIARYPMTDVELDYFDPQPDMDSGYRPLL